MTKNPAFESLALPQLGTSYKLALALLRNSAEAEDAVQEAYLRAFRAFHQFRGGPFRPWMLAIVRNVCYRKLAQQKRGRNVISLDVALLGQDDEEGPLRQIADGADTPEEAALKSGEQSLIRRLLFDLPPALREVLELREVEDLSYAEIAEVTATPIGTVMSRLSRAREALRQLYFANETKDGKHVL